MADRPNLLLIMTDQQRWEALSCASDWVQTPNLDRLAREGVRFTNAVTTSPVCVPARLNFATGRYCHNTGVWTNAAHTMPPDTPTWMQAIRDAGYRTSLFGKTHWHPHQGDIRERQHLLHAYGFHDVDEAVGPRASTRCMCHMTERWQQLGLLEAHRADYKERFANEPWVVRPSALPAEQYYDTYVGQQATRYLRDLGTDRPWFCWVSFPGPHEPWDTPEPYASRYNPDDMPPARPFPQDVAERPQGALDNHHAKWSPTLSEAQISAMRADYAGNVTLIDDQVGELLRVLEQRGELNNTVIAFTSDHGEMNGDAGKIYKNNFLDGSVRVPVIVRAPHLLGPDRAGVVHESPVEWSDLGPTLAELAGATLQHRQFGRSLAPVLADPTRRHRDDALSEISGETMLMTPRWKLALNADGAPYLLFDRHNDPHEQTNLAGDPGHQQITEQLRLRLLDRLTQSQTGHGIK